MKALGILFFVLGALSLLGQITKSNGHLNSIAIGMALVCLLGGTLLIKSANKREDKGRER